MGLLAWLKSKLFLAPAEPAPAQPPFTAAPTPSPAQPAPAGRLQPQSSPTQSQPQPAPSQHRGGTLDLDAGDFLPIQRDELVAGAKQNQGWGNVWFGRRDLIPPAVDARTKLIDRGMVTNGFLSPEQLVEMHQVGDEMERLRPKLIMIQHQANLAGEAAIEADRQRRAAIKEQKKKEAAEKKLRRADAVAHRKATDILFLGRGVSQLLGDRHSDLGRLAAQGLPPMSTPADLAAALGLTIPRLRWLAFHSEVAQRIHYVHFTVPKKNGGQRTLSAPHKQLAAAQRWIFENILSKLAVESVAHGFVAERSILTNARPHAGKAVVFNLDLRDFFPSITFPRVRSVFHRLGYSSAVATIIALLCTECPRRRVEYDGKPYWVAVGPRGLPQGACTSPALSNQVARRLDKRLGGLAAKMGVAYTRYADDLTFSGDAGMSEKLGYLHARVRHLAQEEGFALHDEKTRALRRHAAQTVTGLVVNDRPNLPRATVRRIRAILHRARTHGLDAQNRAGHPRFRAWLEGMIAFAGMVRPELGKRWRETLQAIRK